MQIDSAIVAQLQTTQGSRQGIGIDVPEALLPSISIPMPVAGLQSFATLGALNLENSPYSGGVSDIINQGASQGGSVTELIKFDRGIYRVWTTLYVFAIGQSSSADPYRVHTFLTDGNGFFYLDIAGQAATTGLTTSLPWHCVGTFQFQKLGFSLKWQRQNTAAGQSIGAIVSAYAERLT